MLVIWCLSRASRAGILNVEGGHRWELLAHEDSHIYIYGICIHIYVYISISIYIVCICYIYIYIYIYARNLVSLSRLSLLSLAGGF